MEGAREVDAIAQFTSLRLLWLVCRCCLAVSGIRDVVIQTETTGKNGVFLACESTYQCLGIAYGHDLIMFRSFGDGNRLFKYKSCFLYLGCLLLTHILVSQKEWSPPRMFSKNATKFHAILSLCDWRILLSTY